MRMLCLRKYRGFVYGGVSILGVGVLWYMVRDYMSPSEVLLYIESNRTTGVVLFAGIMFLATVVAPVTVLPLVPAVSPLLGPFATALAACIGWTLGAIVAFCIARTLGQSVVYRLVPKRHIDAVSKYFEGETGFIKLVVLRMVVPVDALSYALGLFTKVPFSMYVYSTCVGVVWFSFAFAYMGNFVATREYVHFAAVSVASVAILYISWRYVRK